jgi:UPF0755 protein
VALSTGSKVFLALLVLVFGLVGGGLWWVNDQISGEPGEGDPVTITIAGGATAGRIGEVLVSESVVKNATAFRLIARNRDLDRNLQAGSYEFRTGMSIDEAIDVLLAGPPEREQIRFRVEEGLTVAQVLERLGEQFDAHSAADFRAVLDERLDAGGNGEGMLRLPEWVPPLDEFGPEVREPFEGLLFPQTYDVFAEATPVEILQKMVDQLDAVVSGIPEDQVAAAEARGLATYDVVVLASLVERETRVEGERPTVAGVLTNRLDEGMLLQVDATCLYALGEHRERVLQADCEVDSPYNTYVTAGLPPTPISNVGRASLEAAFAPEEHDLRFYVLAPGCDGTHAFAPTLDEHNRNVQAFRDAGRCGAS